MDDMAPIDDATQMPSQTPKGRRRVPLGAKMAGAAIIMVGLAWACQNLNRAIKLYKIESQLQMNAAATLVAQMNMHDRLVEVAQTLSCSPLAINELAGEKLMDADTLPGSNGALVRIKALYSGVDSLVRMVESGAPIEQVVALANRNGQRIDSATAHLEAMSISLQVSLEVLQAILSGERVRSATIDGCLYCLSDDPKNMEIMDIALKALKQNRDSLMLEKADMPRRNFLRIKPKPIQIKENPQKEEKPGNVDFVKMAFPKKQPALPIRAARQPCLPRRLV